MNLINPNAKAIAAFIVGWLAVNLTPELMTQFNEWLGLSVPLPLVTAFVAFVVALCVWLVPNKPAVV